MHRFRTTTSTGQGFGAHISAARVRFREAAEALGVVLRCALGSILRSQLLHASKQGLYQMWGRCAPRATSSPRPFEPYTLDVGSSVRARASKLAPHPLGLRRK